MSRNFSELSADHRIMMHFRFKTSATSLRASMLTRALREPDVCVLVRTHTHTHRGVCKQSYVMCAWSKVCACYIVHTHTQRCVHGQMCACIHYVMCEYTKARHVICMSRCVCICGHRSACILIHLCVYAYAHIHSFVHTRAMCVCAHS